VADGTNFASFSILRASVLVVGTKWKSVALLAWILLLVFKRAVRAAKATRDGVGRRASASFFGVFARGLVL
jgi:hypothetical protein